MRLIKALAFIGGLLALASPAAAQSGCGGQFGALRFCGSIAGGLPGPIMIPAGGTTPINPGTVLGNPGAGPGTSLPVATSTPILGVAGSVVGTIGFRNLTTGSVTLQPITGALGSNVLTIPAITDTIAGFALANGGTNNALTASNGGIVWSDASKLNILSGTATARQMLQSGATATPAWSTATWPTTTTINQILFSSAANTIGGISTVNGGVLNANSSGVPAMTITPVLGVPTVSQGTLGFAGITGGTATVTAQATAGSPTITLPNTTGTLADGASLPIVLSATTGNLTCPTCVTSSGGGAITGTAPIAVSAAGVVSITGAAGQVLAGASPAFTATPVLGASGTAGTIGFGNATSGIVTLGTVTGALGTVTASLPANTGTIAETNFAQTWSANQSFNSGNLILNGSGSGSTTLNAPATGGGTATLFAGSDTVTGIAAAQTLTNKTITSSTDVLGGVTMTLGSDATGDIYYRNVSGILTRLPIGSSTNVLTVSSGLPSWQPTGSGGTVTTITAGTGILLSSGATCTTTCTISLTAARQTLPTVQTFTSGTAATYTTAANALWLEVGACGGGGGGSGGSALTTLVAGSAGSASTFNSVNANGGSPGSGSAAANSPPVGGAGGTGGTGTATRRMAGGAGMAGINSTALATASGAGGNSVLWGGGGAGLQPGTTVGNAGIVNTGGGGGGAYNTGGTNNIGGAGGGGGECFYLIINSPSATYTYTVGPGGAGGVSTTNGGAGAAGIIQVIEHYGT